MLYFIKLNPEKFIYNCEFIKKLSMIVEQQKEFETNQSDDFWFGSLNYRKIDNFWYIKATTKIVNEALCVPNPIFKTFISEITITSSYAIIYDGYNLSYIKNPSQELITKLNFYQDKDILITTKYKRDKNNIIRSFMSNRPNIHQLLFLSEIFYAIEHDLDTVKNILNQDKIGYEYEIDYNGFRILPCNKIAAYGLDDPNEYILHKEAFLSLIKQYIDITNSKNHSGDYQRTEIIILGNYAKITYDNSNDLNLFSKDL